MQKKRSSILWSILLAILFVLVCFAAYQVEAPGLTLQKITQTRLVDEAKSNSLISHFTYRYPQKVGIDKIITLPVYDKEQLLEQTLQNKKDLETLNQLDFSKCTNSLSKKTLCNAFQFYLLHEISLAEYPYFSEPFAPYSGIQNELPILLTEYSFETARDARDYLKILELLPDYLSGLCQYEKEKAAQGLFMSDESANQVIQTLDTFCALPDQNNPYLTTFETRLKNLYTGHKISKKEYTYLSNENERLIKTVVFPAFQKTADSLLLLKAGDKSSPKGLFHYPNGKEYYETLVCTVLGEDVPITSLKNLFCRQLQEDYTEMNALLNSHTDYFVAIMGKEKQYDPFINKTPEECIKILQSQIGQDFGEVNQKKYPYEIKSVNSAMENYTNPAYYFTPPVDDISHNIIYINHAQTPSGIALFTTLAHEGFPGHLYQSVTSQRLLKENSLPSLSGITGFGGFIEGYATYVEFQSYEYAKKAAAEISLNNQASYYYEYQMLQRKICLNLFSILDIMIHYEGASANDVAPFLRRIGITEESEIKSIYDYIATEPGTYIKYFGGYMEILECKNLAKDVWGENYNEQAFHEELLELGPIDFFSLKNKIKGL